MIMLYFWDVTMYNNIVLRVDNRERLHGTDI